MSGGAGNLLETPPNRSRPRLPKEANTHRHRWLTARRNLTLILSRRPQCYAPTQEGAAEGRREEVHQGTAPEICQGPPTATPQRSLIHPPQRPPRHDPLHGRSIRHGKTFSTRIRHPIQVRCSRVLAYHRFNTDQKKQRKPPHTTMTCKPG